MPISTKFINLFFSLRLNAIDHFRNSPDQVQYEQFSKLLKSGCQSQYLKEHGVLSQDVAYSQFASRVPVRDYDSLQPWIERLRDRQERVLWNTPVEWFARSSGTTADRSKYIPITRESLNECHFQGGRDVMGIFAHNFPETKAFEGKTLTLGGSHKLDKEGGKIHSGDLSAILIDNTPAWVNMRKLPSTQTALIADFEEKVECICRETTGRNITSFAGVPSWNLVLMNKILDYTGKKNILEVWPDMSLFIHGGVSFTPYREQYQTIIPSAQMNYMETYNASEGFFALQDDPSDSSMLLMLDYGIFYEFLAMKDIDYPERTIPLEGVQTGVNYAMIITTNGGLWRYMIGDTVEFTSLRPHKIRITGRTKHYINAFGEELIVDNAERALMAACQATNAVIAEYTAAPVFMSGNKKGSHQWLLEFEREPNNLTLFVDTLDDTLRQVNSDYDAKRFRDTTLNRPEVVLAERGTFYRWMEKRGKVGGQNKVPRLANNRQYIEQLLDI